MATRSLLAGGVGVAPGTDALAGVSMELARAVKPAPMVRFCKKSLRVDMVVYW
jgi:hypothetical protein